jgi:hypothetical protein
MLGKNKIFAKENINDNEFLLLAKLLKREGLPNEEIILNIDAIDDLLGLMKMQLIFNNSRRTKTGKLRKNQSLNDVIGARLELLAKEYKTLKTN